MSGKEKVLAIYIVMQVLFDILMMSGTAYVVFGLGNSAWWFLLTVVCCSGSNAIIKYTTGIDVEKDN